jgi:hypothetical protein
VARFQVESALRAADRTRLRLVRSSLDRCAVARLGLRRRWDITVASFCEPHPGSDDELLLAWAREVLRKSPPPVVPALPS